jgi:hypothetical protein
MSDNLEFSIKESTLAKMLSLKEESGYGKKGWDEWLGFVLNLNSSEKSTKNEIEEIMRGVYYDKLYDLWVQNFALNLNNIWNESSARELDPTKNLGHKTDEHSAIVIGRGPSIKKHKHLELLSNSKYKGTIVCTDGALINALEAGVTPDKFPRYFVVTIDALEVIKEYYNSEIVNKYGNKIKGIFSTVTHPAVLEYARHSGIKPYWLHTLFDYNEGKKSFNQISALMVRSKNHVNGLPAIQTGGNVGTSSWFASWQILKCSVVGLIGIDHGWNEDDPWELIISHGHAYTPPKLDKESPTFKKLFPKIYNPDFKCYSILDPIFQYYSNGLKEFISRSPSGITTINATEGGSIFGERIKCTTFEDFLHDYQN